MEHGFFKKHGKKDGGEEVDPELRIKLNGSKQTQESVMVASTEEIH